MKDVIFSKHLFEVKIISQAMDKCVRMVVTLAMTSHIVSGRSYDGHEDFHHAFEHHLPKQWHNGKPGWDPDRASANYQRPLSYNQRDHKNYPHKYTNEDKEFWRTHNSNWDSGSWEYPDFAGHGHPDPWFHQHHQGGGNNHGKPNHWPHQPPGPSIPNRPTWNQANPSTWDPIITPPSTSPRSTTESGSRDTLAVLLCIRSCPVTAEYNPVCGSNNVTYGNPGRLECAKYCGVDVNLKRNSACPPPGLNNPTATQNQTTVRPNQPTVPTLKPIAPTRFTTIEIPPTVTNRPPPTEPNPPFTISPDIINSIFTPSTTPEVDFDIDIRTRIRQQYE